jgi:hypothetical protein
MLNHNKQNNMKYLILIVLVTMAFMGKAQDSLFVSNENTTYLVFPSTVDLFELGNKLQYTGSVDDKVLFIRALKSESQKSTLLVRAGDVFYHYMIFFKQNPEVYYYDFTKGQSKLDDKEIKSKPNGIMLQKKVDSIVNIKGEITSLGVISDYLQAAVTVIRNDKENTYLKIVIKNLSSIPYKFDFISFQYYQVMKKGTFKKTKNAPKDVFPIISPKKIEINANATDVVGYAIPQFGLANNGYLIISFREKSGDRVLKMKIDSGKIQSAKYFNF